jgi:hypothetical protein
MSVPRDSSSDGDDIAAIANLNNEFFYTHFFDESDTDSDDDACNILGFETRNSKENDVCIAFMYRKPGKFLRKLVKTQSDWSFSRSDCFV